MKQSYIILIFILSCIVVEAQTKEETIKWIKEKLEKYHPKNFREAEFTFLINECELKVYSNWGSKTYSVASFPTNIDSIKSDGTLCYSFKAVKQQLSENNIDWGEAKYYQYGNLLEVDKEVDLAKRLEKALKHLASFCASKKTEVF